MFKINSSYFYKFNPKAFLIDLDNTLYEYNPCHEYALMACWKYSRGMGSISFLEFKKFYELAKKDVKKYTIDQAASHSRFLYFQRFLERRTGGTCINTTIKLERLYWNSFLNKMNLSSGVLEFLKECRKKDIKICLITDLTAKIQFEKIKRLKIGSYIDFIVSSEESGHDKPHQNIFRLALQKLKMRSKDVVLIGDDYNKDLAGGEKMGIKTILIK